MRGQSVPDQQQRPAAELAAEVGEEVDELHFVETVAHDAEVHSTSTPVPAIGQDRADGELLPVERMSEHRCSSTRSPGPPDRGPLRNAAFIEENYPCTPGLRFFFTSSHVWDFHCATFCSSRSRARKLGRCRLQPMR